MRLLPQNHGLEARARKMTREELEFQISQYADNTLSAEESPALEVHLATDAETQQLLSEYRRLNAHIARHLPLPELNWDRLAEHLSSVITEAADVPAVAGRIAPTSGSTWSWRSRLAIAASVILVLGGGALLFKSQQPGGVQPVVPVAPQSTAMVLGPQAESATGAVVQEITVGPSKALAARGDSWRYAEGVVARPSSVVIAGEMKPVSDGESFIH